MRFRDFKLTEQQLDELKMSPSSLGAFAKSPVAKGIKAGFEAELVFPGLAGEGDNLEPDYDEDARVTSIDGIIDFFSNDDHGWASSSRTLSRVESELQDGYHEYADEEIMDNFRGEGEQLIRDFIEENDWDADDYIYEYLTDQLGLDDEQAEEIMVAGQKATSLSQVPKEYLEARKAADSVLDARAEESFNSQDGNYERVLDNYRADYSYPEESDYLSGQGLDYMSEVANRFELDWPIWRGSGDEGGYTEDSAQQLADDLNKTLGYPVKVSSGYHAQRKDTTHWYFEPDGSLDANDEEDMPVEIVSPPMELEQCLQALEDFFGWAKGHGAYTNRSTGFHMGVSLPNVGGKVDFVKLALFLGDEYVLQEFGRQAVAFTESAMKKIRSSLKGGNDTRIDTVMSMLRKSLLDIAHETIASSEGFGKYTSINPKGNYIEFRSAGNTDYQADISKLRNTLLRYAQAMVVAADPQLERKEYYKKLYKLISPAGNSTMELFARFASGTITKDELKQQWATTVIQTDTSIANAEGRKEVGNWELYDKVNGLSLHPFRYFRMGYEEAMDRARQSLSPGSTPAGFARQYEAILLTQETGKWVVIEKASGKAQQVIDGDFEEARVKAKEEYDLQGPYYIRPYVEFDKSEIKAAGGKPLSRRAELAKRIQTSGDKLMWQMVNDETGERGEPFAARSLEYAKDVAKNLARQLQYRGGYTVQPAEAPAAKPAQPGEPTTWRAANRNTGRQFGGIIFDATREEAERRTREQALQHGLNPDDYMVEPHTPAPAPAQLTSNQETSPNGVPMWEIYNRVSNEPLIRVFADHTQTSAWQTAQTWARENGYADNLNDLSVRPYVRQR